MLIPIKQAELRYNVSRDNIQVTVSQYKRKHGKHPEWYIRILRSAYIDTEAMKEYFENVKYIRNYITSYLIWELREVMTIREVSKYLVSQSEHNKNMSSWESWLSTGMFKTPRDTPNFAYKKSMAYEFYIHGKQLLKEYNGTSNKIS